MTAVGNSSSRTASSSCRSKNGTNPPKLAGKYTPESEITYELFVRGTEPTETANDVPEELPAVKGLTAVYDQAANAISVSWSYDEQTDETIFEVRVKDGQGQTNTITTKDRSITISNPTPGWTYTIAVYAKDGERMSKPAIASVHVPGGEDQTPAPQQPGDDSQGSGGQNGGTDQGNSGNNGNENDQGNNNEQNGGASGGQENGNSGGANQNNGQTDGTNNQGTNNSGQTNGTNGGTGANSGTPPVSPPLKKRIRSGSWHPSITVAFPKNGWLLRHPFFHDRPACCWPFFTKPFHGSVHF